MGRNASVSLGDYFTKVLRGTIQEGIESGTAEGFDPKKYLESLKANKRTK
ncbi:hypothetical protein HX052_04310 [Myroides marinus]|nr:hypothetical protein [Myroides marinus]MDM1370779.1 hypothetical protein [Myroides marinus]MDM1389195.1 hypothetical protein [Myroides marinus]MDM1503726.1 hypothetical protein [Myroides marinus]MDM1531847.1 hypothetical protein [Myroides marinus]MDM1538729.1 hypothetical protein [Myroides marinus]